MDHHRTEPDSLSPWSWERASPRTDMAVEARELAEAARQSLRGVREEVEDVGDVRVSRIHVQTRAGERLLGKRMGRYVTLDVPKLRRRDPALQAEVSRLLAAEIRALADLPEGASVLVVGLGNEHVTPDALGPKVVERLFVTRHLFRYVPGALGDGYRTVAAVSPGVLGVTGIETSEIVQGIVEHVEPDVVIVVDALASRSLDRVNASIQISDTGIQPGSGVGNKRKAIDAKTLGCKVYAIGVPTVVDAATIANDAMDLVLSQLRQNAPGNAATELFDRFSSQEKWQLIRELLEPLGHNLMVTPKEVDEFIDDTAEVVAKGLNLVLHPVMNEDTAAQATH
ncbi:MAG: GPR endopeptidase [Alicyclobacillus sp.]|nr:GPR endopeptidase [Alicyclobacillus sp.]